MLLEDKVCLVTGSSRGIGRAIAKRFAEEGAIVYASARNIDSLASLVDEAAAEDVAGKIIAISLDVCDELQCKEAMMLIKKNRGRLDVLVNNAGIMKDALIGMINKALMEESFETNVYGPINLIQLASKLMKRQGCGSIINLSSIVGTEGNKNQVVYSATKGAVASLTKSAAKELAEYGIRVNAVAPGIIDTDLFRAAKEKETEKMIESIRLGRLGQPIDVANVCVFFASDLSLYVSGQILGVDGIISI